MQTRTAATGTMGLRPAVVATLTERLGLALAVTFRSRWKRLTWLLSAALLLPLVTGAIATLAAPAQFPFPAGTVRFSWAKGYCGGW